MKKLLLILSAIIFIFSVVPENILAAEEYTKAEKELAAELEFMFEEAIIKDELDNPIGLDIKKIESRYGEVPSELQELENEITPMINPSDPHGIADKIRVCMRNSVKNEWGVILGGAVIGTFYGYIEGKNYIKAAKLLIKHGARGTVMGIAGSLTAQYIGCALKA
ncbi:hypothetical protein MKY34_03945 [Sporosarcina sp. FSL K6-1522]|uniref:hypothetical protein n=1 Tax=Sporosarcina sp. FSL K6-1522 TaxID=2921554 RepID=UPI003159C421